MREGKVKFKGVGFTRPCSSISTRTFEHGGCPQTSKSSFYLSDSSFLFFRFYNEQLISFFLSFSRAKIYTNFQCRKQDNRLRANTRNNVGTLRN